MLHTLECLKELKVHYDEASIIIRPQNNYIAITFTFTIYLNNLIV
jgi:hypothetical protein